MMQVVPAELADAMLANFAAAFAHHSALDDSAAACFGPFRAFDSGPGVLANVVIAGEPPGDGPFPLGAIETWYAARHSEFRVAVREPGDAALVAALVKRGYMRGTAEPALALSPLVVAEDSPPAPLELAIVDSEALALAYAGAEGDDAGLDLRAAIARRSLAQPGCTMVAGFVDGVPVARAMALVTNGLAGVFNVTVRPGYRRNGFGTAVTNAVLAASARDGATAAMLATTPMGYRLYRRLGFEPVFDLVTYWPPGATIEAFGPSS